MANMNRLVEICRSHTLDEGRGVVISEPYIPYLPENWNGVLVLAEAQNLSTTNQIYIDKMKSVSSDERIRRLYLEPNGSVGIQPWDDKSLQLAVEAALGLESAKCGVSNAVLWSVVHENGQNKNPTKETKEESAEVWAEMLPLLEAKRIVCAGVAARQVAAKALKVSGLKPELVKWALPSPRVLSPLALMVNEQGMLRRFREVAMAVERHPEWLKKGSWKNKILYASLAVSIVGESG